VLVSYSHDSLEHRRGQGNLVAGFIGVLILALVDNTMNLVGISALVQPAVKGAILILTVLAYSRRSGSVNLSRPRRRDGRKGRPSEHAGRIFGNFGEFAPGNESRRELFAIEGSAQQMPVGREVLPDRPKAREKILCAFRVSKAAHATLAFARWLVSSLRGCSVGRLL